MNGLYEVIVGIRRAFEALASLPEKDKKRIQELGVELGNKIEKVVDEFMKTHDEDMVVKGPALFLSFLAICSSYVREQKFDVEEYMKTTYDLMRVCMAEKGVPEDSVTNELLRLVLREQTKRSSTDVI